jgi:hypothetical protein
MSRKFFTALPPVLSRNYPTPLAQCAVLIVVVVNATLAWRGLGHPKTAVASVLVAGTKRKGKERANVAASSDAGVTDLSGEDENAPPAHKRVRTRRSARRNTRRRASAGTSASGGPHRSARAPTIASVPVTSVARGARTVADLRPPRRTFEGVVLRRMADIERDAADAIDVDGGAHLFVPARVCALTACMRRHRRRG